MTRLVATAFTGSAPRDCVRGAPIYRRAYRRAVGEIAKIYQMYSGEYGEANTIRHQGGTRGCPLNLALANQDVSSSLIIASGGSDNAYWVVACPVFVPVGASGPYQLQVDMHDPREFTVQANQNNARYTGVFCEIRNSSFTSTYGPTQGVISETFGQQERGEQTFPTETQDMYKTFSWTVNLSEGINYILVDAMLYVNPNRQFFRSWRCFPVRDQNVDQTSPMDISAIGNKYLCSSTMTTTTIETIHSESVDENGPLCGYVTHVTNRNANKLWEWITGDKIPGNETYISAQPVRHNGLVWATEPTIDIEYGAYCLGSSLSLYGGSSKPNNAALDTNPTTGLTGYYRAPRRHCASQSCHRTYMYMPFRNNSVSNRKATVFFKLEAGTATNYRFNVRMNGNPILIGVEGTPALLSGVYYKCDITGIPTTEDAYALFDLMIRHTAPAASFVDQISLLGIVYYQEG